MLTEICAYLKNYFCLKEDILIGDYSISGGEIAPSIALQEGQYYRIVGSVFNDGVHASDDVLKDEDEFHGAIWKMRIPQDVIALAAEIEDWQDKYGGVDSQNMSPYQSESFGGYSYTKASGYVSNGTAGNTSADWQQVYAMRLAPYRRIRVL